MISERPRRQIVTPFPRQEKRATSAPIAGDNAPVVLMARSDIINLKKAVELAKRSPKTVRGWCRQHGIGRQSGPCAPMEISAPGLEMVIHGDFEALDKLRMGEREDPVVRRYFEWLGLPADRPAPF